MGFAINTNNDALNTYRNLTNVQNSLSKSLERLSSGLRINQAGDDAAGLTISTQLGAQVSGLQQAARNAQDGTSLVQTADGALSQAQSILGRLRDLAVQAGNDSNSTSARAAITSEATSLTAELARIGSSVNFNGTNLLDGSTQAFRFQVGADGNSQSQITVDLSGANLAGVAAALTNGSSGDKFTTAQIKTVTSFIATNDNGSTTKYDVSDATSDALTAADGYTNSSMTAAQLNEAKVDKAIAALSGDSAFSATFTAVKINDSGTFKLLVTAKDGSAVTSDDGTGTNGALHEAGTAAVANAGSIKFDSAVNAQAAITAIDAQIANVSKARANIGAIENRFNNVVSTISTSVQNLTAAKSRITDVDMAQEMVNYTRANVLSQSGTAMLAQANSLPQLALKLLG
ncbi:flagellin [Amnibacterium endophyticum]|uniref:Flagellin n=1 Tax=Amnibacterium endophyticum TaxID=2109337 RepID=A0ABW4LHH0_9MICO